MDKQVKKPSKKLYDELVDLLLKKANLKKEEVYRTALKCWANNNLDLLTPAEQKRYSSIML